MDKNITEYKWEKYSKLTPLLVASTAWLAFAESALRRRGEKRVLILDAVGLRCYAVLDVDEERFFVSRCALCTQLQTFAVVFQAVSLLLSFLGFVEPKALL